MIEGWRFQPLGETTDNFDRVRLPIKESDRRHGPYPYYGASGIVDHVDGYLFDGEYLLIAEDGENLRTRTTPVAFIANGRFWVNNHAHVVRGNHRSDTRFLMYALSATDMAGYLTGSTLPKLTQGNLNRITLAMPPLPEQRAIASILGRLDDKIELNRRMSDTLEGMARVLFKSWFVDFDPVRTKAASRHSDLPAPLGELFPDTFTDTALGPVPTGWSVGPLGAWSTPTIGGDWGDDDPSERRPVKVRCLRGIDLHRLRSDGWSDAPIRFISMRSMEQRASTSRDVLVEGSGQCGRSLAVGPYIERIYPEPVIYSNFCKRIRLESPPQAMYVERLLNRMVRSGDMNGFVTGTAMPNLDLHGLLSGLTILMPDSIALEKFNDLETSVRYRHHSHESMTLAAIRDALLPKLISGELRVPDAERIAVEAGA